MDGIRSVVASPKPSPRLKHDGVKAAITRSSEAFEVNHYQANISPISIASAGWQRTQHHCLRVFVLRQERVAFPETRAEYADLTLLLPS